MIGSENWPGYAGKRNNGIVMYEASMYSVQVCSTREAFLSECRRSV